MSSLHHERMILTYIMNVHCGDHITFYIMDADYGHRYLMYILNVHRGYTWSYMMNIFWGHTLYRALELDINLRGIWKIIVLRNEFE